MSSQIKDSDIKDVLYQIDQPLKINSPAIKLVKSYLLPLEKEFKNVSTDAEARKITIKMLPGELAKHAISEGTKASMGLSKNVVLKINFGKGNSKPNAYANAVVEYIMYELLQLSSNAADSYQTNSITPRFIKMAVETDYELADYVNSIKIKSSAKKPAPKKPASKKVTVKKVAVKKVAVKSTSTVAELKKKAKARGFTGYSKLRKADLIKLLAASKGKKPAPKGGLTVVQLKARCKKKGIKGYSALRKAELVKKCK